MSTTYILKCLNGNYYIGSTSDIARRLKEHDEGKSRTTRSKLPVKIVYQREFETLKEARQFEYFIKRQRNFKFYRKLFKGEIIWPRRLAA